MIKLNSEMNKLNQRLLGLTNGIHFYPFIMDLSNNIFQFVRIGGAPVRDDNANRRDPSSVSGPLVLLRHHQLYGLVGVGVPPDPGQGSDSPLEIRQGVEIAEPDVEIGVITKSNDGYTRVFEIKDGHNLGDKV